MLLDKIILHHFRNFKKKEFVFSPFLTIIIGENSKGKTNLLEAAYCLTHGTGFRESKEEELIMIGEVNAKLESIFSDNEEKINLQINLHKMKTGLEKKYLVNKTNKKLVSFKEEGTKSVLFSPEQLSIISGPPEERRQYLDKEISFYDLTYKKKLNNYYNALRKRNKILESHYSDEQLADELFFWDDYLVEQGAYVSEKRKEYIWFLNQNQELDSKRFYISFQANEMNKKRLKEVFETEKKYRRTVIGPQKDDFQIYLDEKDIHLFGSRSEHRLAIFWLKINEIKYFENIFQRKPLLLLDDVFSELDLKNKKLILDLIKKYQTILTTADKEIINLTSKEKQVIRI